MNKIIYLFCISICISCTSTQIKNENYTVSDTAPELGSIGFTQLEIRGGAKFEVKSLPKLESSIRLTIDVIPFSNKTYKIYTKKARYNQDQTKISYSDSLLIKPELVTIGIMDFVKLVSEINGEQNEELFRFLKDTEESKIVTSLSCVFSTEDIQKIKQSDAYYLNEFQDNKYAIELYKLGKKTDVISISSSQVLAYKSSKFCWGITDRGKWYIADIINTNSACKGKTAFKIKNKKAEKNLFDF